jgi:uncharacterized cupin superfamily protein
MLEIGTRSRGESGVDYPDIDLIFPSGGKAFQHRDGRPYEKGDYRS